MKDLLAMMKLILLVDVLTHLENLATYAYLKATCGNN
ncbi:hypothetical protein KOY_03583 [Bacillus cereus VDM021]|nr:hypothetical protein IIW_04714 [Bacillus cereus VD136]EOP76133.1 hypothetical protein KOW_04455 [Bacillus cereus VDM006]EOQ15799.1 hypothetical protein KOY_03583 [Bacillus cereus VDM021]